MTLLTRFQNQIKQNEQISKSDRVLVAFSGGKDSVCLLFLLQKTSKEFGFEIGACHVHHGIRGEEADRDLEFCRDYCKTNGIPFYYDTVDAPAFCEEKGYGLEEGARILRYEALNRVAKLEGYTKIATAHSASDQAETVLFHLIRGSGFGGMRGIPENRDNIIRPLLPFYKEEILDFLHSNHLSFKEDSTNCDKTYSRNRLRKSILPEMEKINPSVQRSLVRFSEIAKEESDLVSYLCDLWEKENRVDYAYFSIELSALEKLMKKQAMMPVFKEAVSRLARKENIVIDFQHLKSLETLLKAPREGKIIEISDGFIFQIINGKLVFKKNEAQKTRIDYQVKLRVGENPLPLPQTSLTISDKKCGKVENINKNLLIIHAAFDKIEGELFVRNRREGDTVTIGGMTKSIKKLFQEARIPADVRDRFPLICDAGGIIWMPLVGLCDRMRNSSCDEIFTMELDGSFMEAIK